MASFELEGKLIAKYDTVQRTETFKTREFVVESSEDVNGRVFTNYAKFQCTQDRTQIIDRFNMGDSVKVTFNIRGSKWERDGKVNYITNLDAWRIEAAGMPSQPSMPQQSQPQASSTMPPMDNSGAADDDLPF